MEKWTILGLKQEIYKMNLEHFIAPERKEVIKIKIMLFLKNVYLIILGRRECVSTEKGRERGERESQAGFVLTTWGWVSLTEL